MLQHFYPRSHEGNDEPSIAPESSARIVSIHVPTRGTTVIHEDGSAEYVEFQSTFPRGERRMMQKS